MYTLLIKWSLIHISSSFTLIQWSQLGVILPSGSTEQCLDVSFVVTTGEGCFWHLVGRGQGAVKHPTRHQDREPDGGGILRKGSVVLWLRHSDHSFTQLQHSTRIFNYLQKMQCDTLNLSIHSTEVYWGPTICQDCVTEMKTRHWPTRSLHSHRTVETLGRP